jgi:hypothetical protein
MSKLERWLTLVANLSVVAGIIFLAAEMRQNTAAVQAQTRDAITEKQMDFLLSIGTNPEAADVFSRGNQTGEFEVGTREFIMYFSMVQANLREWENSHYQYESGLFSADEFEARVETWRGSLTLPGFLETWARSRQRFSPSFRAEVDRMVAEVEQVQF